MKRTAILARSALSLTFSALACTENARARSFGGTAKIEVKAGHKVVGASWKRDDLWVLTRPMRDGEVPETLIMSESSSWGVVEGHVQLVERDSQESAHKRDLAAKAAEAPTHAGG